MSVYAQWPGLVWMASFPGIAAIASNWSPHFHFCLSPIHFHLATRAYFPPVLDYGIYLKFTVDYFSLKQILTQELGLWCSAIWPSLLFYLSSWAFLFLYDMSNLIGFTRSTTSFTSKPLFLFCPEHNSTLLQRLTCMYPWGSGSKFN